MGEKSLLILGCGGHGRVVADVAQETGYDRIAFLDDAYRSFSTSDPWEVLGPTDMVSALKKEWPVAIAAYGDNAERSSAHEMLLRYGYIVASVIHPAAIVSNRACVGQGVFVAPAAVINTGASIGDGVIINTLSCVDHDSVVEVGAHIAPGAVLAGNVRVGERSMLGASSSVRQGIRIGPDIIVGMGAVVVKDLADPGVYVGVPALRSS